MFKLSRIQVNWWIGFLLSATLPFWLLAIVLNFGGWITEEIDYEFFRFLSLACFVIALYLTIRFLMKPERFFGLRFATGWVWGIFLLLGSCSSIGFVTCEPDSIRLGRLWSAEDRKYAQTAGCEGVALTTQSTRTR